MKRMIAAVFALSLAGIPAANADILGAGVHVGPIGVGAHIGGGHHWHHHCWWHHHHRVCN